MRDCRGRFVAKRAHLYRLVYDDGRHEDVYGVTPSEAVAARKGGRGSLLPHTMTDLTAIEAFKQPRVLTLQPMPLLERILQHKTPASSVPTAEGMFRFTGAGEEWDD